LAKYDGVICSFEGCDRQARNRGYCAKHYNYLWYHGVLTKRTPMDRFREQIVEAASVYNGTKCLLWVGSSWLRICQWKRAIGDCVESCSRTFPAPLLFSMQRGLPPPTDRFRAFAYLSAEAIDGKQVRKLVGLMATATELATDALGPLRSAHAALYDDDPHRVLRASIQGWDSSG
jgi:hypothetical protein